VDGEWTLAPPFAHSVVNKPMLQTDWTNMISHDFAQVVLQHIHHKSEAAFITNIVKCSVMSSQISQTIFFYKLDQTLKILTLEEAKQT